MGKTTDMQSKKWILPLVVHTFSWDETSPISATDSEHKTGNVHVLHSLVSSYPEITVIMVPINWTTEYIFDDCSVTS